MYTAAVQLTWRIKGYLAYCTAKFSLNVQIVRTAEFSSAFCQVQDFGLSHWVQQCLIAVCLAVLLTQGASELLNGAIGSQ